MAVVDSFQPAGLRRTDYPLIQRIITLAAGAVYAEGSVLGRITVGREYNLSVAAATDGSQTPRAVLPIRVDATTGSVQVPAWFSGDFAEDALVFGAGHTGATVDQAFEDAGTPITVGPR